MSSGVWRRANMVGFLMLWPSSQVRDVRAAFAGIPKIRPQWVDRYMKILVVGESGARHVAKPARSRVPSYQMHFAYE